MLEAVELFKDFALIEQFEIILDANIIIRDILWVCTKRKNPSARSDLQELLLSETMLAQAPFFLKEEVNKHLNILAVEKNIELDTMVKAWGDYEQHITFYEVTVEEYEKENIRDPKDLPYIKLQEITGTMIHSKDKDIAAMGGSVITHSVITNLRDYSRDAAIEYSLKIGGVFAGHISKNLIVMVGALLRDVLISIRKLPRWMQWSLISALVFVLVHKPYRQKAMSLIGVFFANSISLIEDILKEAEPMVVAHEKAKIRAEKNLEIIRNKFQK